MKYRNGKKILVFSTVDAHNDKKTQKSVFSGNTDYCVFFDFE